MEFEMMLGAVHQRSVEILGDGEDPFAGRGDLDEYYRGEGFGIHETGDEEVRG